MVDPASALREVQDADHAEKEDISRDFVRLARQLDAMSERTVRSVLQTPLEGDIFPITLPKDEYGIVLVNEEDAKQFFVTRPGDHLCCPLQCELCHFRNIQGRSPMAGTGVMDDSEMMKYLRRVSLDAFWSREPTTVSYTLGKINRALQIAHDLGLKTPPVPRLGPRKLVDEFGAVAAVIMAKHSLDQGVMESTVQYETIRDIKSARVRSGK